MGAKGKLRITQDGYAAYCPGCKSYHEFDGRWRFNGDFDRPTFNPSMLVNAQHLETRCHSFIKDGCWLFLGDCYHELRGQTIEMEVED